MQKEEQLLEKRLLELSRLAYHRDIITYSDFLNSNELHILHSLPKDSLYSQYRVFGGYELAERQMAAFLPDALSLRTEPLHKKYAEELTHRDYLGAMLNLGIDRSKTGDILVSGSGALVFVRPQMKEFLREELTRIRHTTVLVTEEQPETFHYTPRFEEIRGTVASVRLDSLLSLAFGSSRNKLSGLIEGAKVFVNGKLVTSNGYQVHENDIISVRGMGKFRFISELAVTKKKRISVLIHKYI